MLHRVEKGVSSKKKSILYTDDNVHTNQAINVVSIDFPHYLLFNASIQMSDLVVFQTHFIKISNPKDDLRVR